MYSYRRTAPGLIDIGDRIPVTLSVCPATVARVPAERVWSLLAEPAAYQRWMDAALRSVTPPGRAHRGQRIVLRAPTWLPVVPIRFLVESVDDDAHAIQIDASFPLGFSLRSRIAATAIDARSCHVQFG